MILQLTTGSTEEIDENDVRLFDAIFLQLLHRLHHGVARAHDRIEKEDLAQGNVGGQFGVEDTRLQMM